MTSARTLSIIALVAAATGAAAVYAAGADTRIAQATPPSQGMGMGMGMGMSGPAAMPGYPEQMKAMQAMHERMVAAKTPEERNALMAEQMKLMQQGMAMMGRMGPGGMMGGAPGASGAARPQVPDIATRQRMMEQRMDMMHSMMQMMMDRMAPPGPATK